MIDEFPQKLRGLLPKLEYARETHRQWRDCHQSYRDANPDIGDSAFHQQAVDDYDERIRLIKEAADRLEAAERAIREKDEALRLYADKENWHKIVPDSYLGEVDYLDWPGELQDEPWEVAQKALANTGQGGGDVKGA